MHSDWHSSQFPVPIHACSPPCGRWEGPQLEGQVMLGGKAALLGGLGGPSIHYLLAPSQTSLILWSVRLGWGQGGCSGDMGP